MSNADDLIDMLIHGFSESMTFLSDAMDGKILVCNSMVLSLFNINVVGMTLNDILKLPLCPLLLAELQFCQHVESESVTTRKTTIAIEQFNGKHYISSRKLIYYRGKMCVFTQIVEYKGEYNNEMINHVFLV